MAVKFNTTKGEDLLIDEILNRFGISKDRKLSAFMDLSACHCNGCPLDFKKLLESSDGDLFHDVHGISLHINRDTGELEDEFLPRCAKKEG